MFESSLKTTENDIKMPCRRFEGKFSSNYLLRESQMFESSLKTTGNDIKVPCRRFEGNSSSSLYSIITIDETWISL
jgi:hypothetical protein